MDIKNALVRRFKASDELTPTLFGHDRIPSPELLGLVPGPNREIAPRSLPSAPSAPDVPVSELGPLMGSGASWQLINPLGRYNEPRMDFSKLLKYHRRVEIVFACIHLLASAAVDPELQVEKRHNESIEVPEEMTDKLKNVVIEPIKQKVWKPEDRSPLTRLMMRPNPTMSGKEFIRTWIVSLYVFGCFYAEKVRDPETDLVTQMWPIDPRSVQINKSAFNEVISYKVEKYNQQGMKVGEVIIPAEDMFVDRFFDPNNFYFGALSPLSVAFAAAEMDIAQTRYINSYFANAGVPSGLLKLKNQTLGPKKADKIKKRFFDHFAQLSGGQHSVLVLDAEAEYQALGAKLKDLEANSVQGRAECKLCMVFGVPPSLIFSYTGISNNSYTSQQQALPDLWSITLMPLFTRMADVLTWQLGPEFYDEDKFLDKKLRIGWDFSNVKALQEDQDKKELRARENYKDDIITKNEARAVTGHPPDPLGGYYQANVRTTRMYPIIAAQDAATFGSIPATQVIATNKNGDLNEGLEDLDEQVNRSLETDPAAGDAPANSDTDPKQTEGVKKPTAQNEE